MQEALHTAAEPSSGASSLGKESTMEPSFERDEYLVLQVFPCLLDIGEAMLKSGADVHYIEVALGRMGRAYGAVKMNVLVITAAIIATMTLPDGYERTLTRRVVGEGGINFDKLAAMSQLCNECIQDPLPPEKVRARLNAIIEQPLPAWALYLGGIFSAGGFAVFFGGSWLDGLVSAIFALFICYSIAHFKEWTPNTMIFNFGSSLLTGLGIVIVAHFIPAVSTDMVMIGDIMLLIPGVAMTNATRDMLSGDTISGVMRFVESLLWATSLALGFMAAIWLAGVVN